MLDSSPLPAHKAGLGVVLAQLTVVRGRYTAAVRVKTRYPYYLIYSYYNYYYYYTYSKRRELKGWSR